ncbi:MAG: TVP38/TMEM64 family protein [Hyphomonadaceae bacterium]
MSVTSETTRFQRRRLIPLALIAIALVLFFVTGLHRQISLESLRENRALLVGWTEAHPILSGGAFFLVATALMAIGFPSVAVIMAAGGVIFGLVEGGLLALLGTTLGSFILFLAARGARDAALVTRFGAIFTRIERGMARDPFLYLLLMRITPVFPTVAVTLAAAAARIKAWPFLAATLIGLIPAAVIYTGVGAGAGALIDSGETSLSRAFFRPEVLLPLAGLIALGIAAAWVRRRTSRTE